MIKKTRQQQILESNGKKRLMLAKIKNSPRTTGGVTERTLTVLQHYDCHITIEAVAGLTGDSINRVRGAMAELLEDEQVEYLLVKSDIDRQARRAYKLVD